MSLSLIDSVFKFLQSTGFVAFTWQEGAMLLVSFVLVYLGLKKGFEPLLLLPIAFGMLLANLPTAGLMAPPVYETVIDPASGVATQHMKEVGGLLYYLYFGVKFGIYPPLIFFGVGAMTDFGPLIANPKSILLGAAAQLGIFTTFIGALLLDFIPGLTYTLKEAASIGIIGGADGPTAIFLTSKLAPHLLGPIAVAAYSYMALVPLIQPPIMIMLTTQKERETVMEQLREVSTVEKIVFPILVTVIVSIILPAAAPLIGMLMFGNLLREAVAMQPILKRLLNTASNALMDIVVVFLGMTVGATANGALFLQPKTLGIICLGLAAFSVGTAGGVLFGKIMYWATGGKVNPLIGSAGVSAVPMAARVSQVVGQKYNPTNYLLMHAMGPNVAGVIGSAVAAGVLLSMLG
jgi:oxaloacetate decarboxylase beta subunit